jgi:hypothetical protein
MLLRQFVHLTSSRGLQRKLGRLHREMQLLKDEVRCLRERSMDMGFLYVLRDPTLDPDIYKVGRTGDVHKRLAAYPTGTELVASKSCHDVTRRERMLLRLLKRQCEHCPWIGHEYFRADLSVLLRAIDTVTSPEPRSD